MSIFTPRPSTSWWKRLVPTCRDITGIEVDNKPFSIGGRYYAHGHLRIHLRRFTAIPIDAYIAAADANTPGWSNTDIAAGMASAARHRRARGYRHILDHTFFAGPNFGYLFLQWQQYDDDTYCGSPSVAFCHTDASAVVAGTDALVELARIVAKEHHPEMLPSVRRREDIGYVLANPTRVCAALLSAGARYVTRDPSGPLSDFVETDARMVFLTDHRVAA